MRNVIFYSRPPDPDIRKQRGPESGLDVGAGEY